MWRIASPQSRGLVIGGALGAGLGKSGQHAGRKLVLDVPFSAISTVGDVMMFVRGTVDRFSGVVGENVRLWNDGRARTGMKREQAMQTVHGKDSCTATIVRAQAESFRLKSASITEERRS